MDAKDLFKKLVGDAKAERTNDNIMSYGSQHPSDFAKDKKQRSDRNGKFAHLTDEFIDSLGDKDLETEMVTFIYRCFQQR